MPSYHAYAYFVDRFISPQSTCVTTPEVTEGPYYVNNELLRQDIREDQEGVDLVLDIGVIDVTTCTPLDQALVEIWHCNVSLHLTSVCVVVLSEYMQSTGHYSGFSSANGGGTGGGNGTAPSGNMTMPSGNMTMPTGTGSGSPVPTGGAGGGGSTSMTDQREFSCAHMIIRSG
jgi:hypothetical protein